MNVPGPDGRHGFGGPCFPKDVKALIEYSKEVGSELSLLNKANTINNNIRAQYNDATVREKEQNIKFNSKKEEWFRQTCPSGGIGRHKGLKIPR